MAAPNRRAWERRPGEPSRHFNAFNIYLRLGPGRDHRSAARETGLKYETVRSCASRWDWNARAAAWDDHIQHSFTKAAESEAKKMAKRHVQMAQMGQAVVARELQRLVKLQEQRQLDEEMAQAADPGHRLDPKKQILSVSELARLLRVVADLEHRVVMGDPQTMIQDESLEAMTTAEIRAELEANGVVFND